MKVLIMDQIAKVNYKYTYSLANALHKNGADVELVIDQKSESENCNLVKYNLFNTSEKNIGKINKLINYITGYQKVAKIIKANDINILHVQWTIFSPVDYFFLKHLKNTNHIKLVVTIHDILPFNEKFYDFRYHNKIYALADEVIVQADNNVKRFDKLFPALAGKCNMIPLGHFLDYAEPVSRDLARKHLELSDDKLIFLFFGQIKKVKGVSFLLEAFAMIRKEYSNVQLIIAGNVWKDEFSQYQEIIDKYEMQDDVRTDIKFIPDEEIKYYYSACDACVLPYTDVYQSGVIQLAYAYKRVVVATSIGAFKEVVIDQKSGFLCEPEDATSLSVAMAQVIKNKAMLADMGEVGYEVISDKFSWDKIADDIYQLYSAASIECEVNI